MQIEGKKFLVTGGAGLIGSHIVDQVLDAGAAHVTVIDNMLRGRHANLENAIRTNRIDVVEGDIADRELMRRLVEPADGIFHMAALRIKHCIEEPRLAVDAMLGGPVHMFLDAVECGTERIVAASSSSIYGQADEIPTTEIQHPYNDTTFYGACKLAAEGILRSLHATNGLKYATHRFFNVYGPRMDIHGVYTEVMVRWMERIEAGEPPLIFGDGSDSMDFTYVEDAARACVLSMIHDDAHGAYNVGTAVSTDLNDLCQLLLRVMESDLDPEYRPADKRNDVTLRQADISRARADMHFEPQVTLKDGLGRLVAWWREQRAHENAASAAS